MTLTKVKLIAAAISLAFAGPVLAADSMSKDEAKAEKQRIVQEAKANKDKCKDLKANAKDVCMAEARGKEKVAKAELAAKEKDTPKNRYDVAAAKADADYNVAKEKCDDMKGKEKDQCQKDAKAARERQTAGEVRTRRSRRQEAQQVYVVAGASKRCALQGQWVHCRSRRRSLTWRPVNGVRQFARLRRLVDEEIGS